MKKIIFTLIAMLSIVTNANAMSYEQARSEALFLTDKMAYELNLSDAQYEAAYEINLDYLMSVTNRNNVLGTYWERRNADLNYVLYSWQWELFRAATYFFRPLYWDAGYWHFSVYTRYPHRTYFYFGRPRFYDTYRGGHGWRHHPTSYYAHHHVTYRPHHSRDHHFGMRDGWNRGDYRNHGSHSSTHITGRVGHDGRGHDMSGRNGWGHDASGRDGKGIDRRGNTNGVYGNGNRRNDGNSSGRTVRPSDGTSRILTGRSIYSEQRRVSGLSSGSFSRVNSSSTHSSGSFSRANSSSAHSSGSFSRVNSSSAHSSGSFSRGGSSSSRATVSRGGGNGSGRSGGRR